MFKFLKKYRDEVTKKNAADKAAREVRLAAVFNECERAIMMQDGKVIRYASNDEHAETAVFFAIISGCVYRVSINTRGAMNASRI